MPRRSIFASVSFLVLLGSLAGADAAAAQTSAPALTGKVTAEQGALEGVLVSAKKSGSTITITVVSDQTAVTPSRPPDWSLANIPCVFGRSGTILIIPTRSQSRLTRRRAPISPCAKPKIWPRRCRTPNGSPACPAPIGRRNLLLNCVGCHTLERPLRSKFSADEFMNVVLPRMQGYVNQSIPQHPQLRKAERLMEERGDQRVQVFRANAEYLASINLSSHRNGISNSRRCRA